MLLSVSRVLAPFLAPLPVMLCCLLAALALICCRRQRAGVLFLLLALAVLCVSGYGLGFQRSLLQLEQGYPPLNPASLPAEMRSHVRYVVVLGNAHAVEPAWPRSAHLSGSSLRRLVEGIDLYRQLPGSRLVLSGGVNIEPEANAEVVADMARRLGVPAEDLVIENRPRDTLEEAALLAPLLGERPFILVTSAAHMQRAMRLFTERGLRPLPAPTDFWMREKSSHDPAAWVPTCGNIRSTERVLYEWLAEIWKRIRTFFANSPS